MSHDIMPEPAPAVNAAAWRTGLAATGLPGKAEPSVLFASLLAQTSGPPARPVAGTQPVSRSAPNKVRENRDPQTALKAIPIFSPLALPIKLTLMRPITPPTAGVTAETQNAMDTVPVSGPWKAKASETKPGGELPLLKARTAASVALPAIPILLVTAPQPFVKPLPDAAPARQTAGLPTKSGPVAPPAFHVLPTSPDLPRTFLLPVTTKAVVQATEVSGGEVVGAQPVAADGKPEKPAFLPPARPAPALQRPYQATAWVLPTSAEALAPSPPTGKSASLKAMVAAVTASKGVVIPTLTIPTAAEGASESSDVGPETGKLPLKSLPASADNNTGKSSALPASISKPLPTPLRLMPSVQPADVSSKDAISKEPSTKEPSTKEPSTRQAAALVVAGPAAAPPNPEVSGVTPVPLTRTERAAMIRQVADGVRGLPAPTQAAAPSQMTLQLHPKDWGQLQISVRIMPAAGPDAAQTVTAHIVAGSPQIKLALENGSSDLRQTLRRAGLHLERLTVTIAAPTPAGKPSTASSGGHHLMNGGGGQSQPDNRPSGGNTSLPGTASFAAFAGSQGGRQGGAPPQADTGSHAPQGTERDHATTEWDAPRHPASGQVDMRA